MKRFHVMFVACLLLIYNIIALSDDVIVENEESTEEEDIGEEEGDDDEGFVGLRSRRNKPWRDPRAPKWWKGDQVVVSKSKLHPPDSKIALIAIGIMLGVTLVLMSICYFFFGRETEASTSTPAPASTQDPPADV